jgi:myo-inositol-1(or 4)-monophosphatase
VHQHERIENVSKELDTALSAASKAGEVLRVGFGAEHDITYEGEVDLVTEVEAEQVIRKELFGTFPTHGMLAEEGGELAGGEDARWIVDPLDGTTNYAHGLSIFCVSIALERAGEVVLGVVHDPMRKETFVAERGRGATLNGDPINVGHNEVYRRGRSTWWLNPTPARRSKRPHSSTRTRSKFAFF